MKETSQTPRETGATYPTPSASPEFQTRLPSLVEQELTDGSLKAVQHERTFQRERAVQQERTIQHQRALQHERAVQYEILPFRGPIEHDDPNDYGSDSDGTLCPTPESDDEFRDQTSPFPSPPPRSPDALSYGRGVPLLPPVRGLLEEVRLSERRQQQQAEWEAEQQQRMNDQGLRDMAQDLREYRRDQPRFYPQQRRPYNYHAPDPTVARRPLPTSRGPPQQLTSQPNKVKKRAAPRNPTGQPRTNKKYTEVQTNFLLYWRCDKRMGWDQLLEYYNKSFPGENRSKPGLQGRLYRQNLVFPVMDESMMLTFDENDDLITVEFKLRRQGEHKWGLLRRKPYVAIRYSWVDDADKAAIGEWGLAQQRQLDEAAMRKQQRRERGYPPQ